MMNIKTVTVIGATGSMGIGVAGIFASFGNARVYCVGRDIDKVHNTIPKIVQSVRADSIRPKLLPADYSMLEQCVSESDLVFESVKEDISLKSEIMQRISHSVKTNTLLCSGTSGLSITELAKHCDPAVRGQVFGVHMFNPPYSLSLCEVISTPYSNCQLKADLITYLRDLLHRTVVDVKDTPSFLGNRIGFSFLNEALQYAERYKDNGGIDYIDSLLGPFTGRAMAPLRTVDFVGLDVHKAIVDHVYNNTYDYNHESFKLPEFVNLLINENKLGKKTGIGLYKTNQKQNGFHQTMVYDLNSKAYREIIPYAFPFVSKMRSYLSEGDYSDAFRALLKNQSSEAEITTSFLIKYIIYSLYCAMEVADTIYAADDAMATGFNWCPPIAFYQALSAVVDVRKIIQERLPEIIEKVDIDKLFDEKYADLIKEKLLSELKVSEEFRAMIDEGSSISLVTALKSLVDGKLDTFKVDSVMASTLINAVDLYATKNNTTYSDLVSENGSTDLLKGAMTDFTKVNDITNSVNEVSIQEKLLAIYEGNEVNSESSDVIKGYVDALSDNAGTDYESLLTDSSFKDKVYDETNSLNRVTKYADLLSNCSKDQIIKSLRTISSKKSNSSGSSSSSSTKSNSGSLSTGSSDFVFSTEPLVVLDM